MEIVRLIIPVAIVFVGCCSIGGVAAVIDRVKVLAGHPDLIRGFNMSMPRGYKPRDQKGGSSN